jgi:hypothetical protein
MKRNLTGKQQLDHQFLIAFKLPIYLYILHKHRTNNPKMTLARAESAKIDSADLSSISRLSLSLSPPLRCHQHSLAHSLTHAEHSQKLHFCRPLSLRHCTRSAPRRRAISITFNQRFHRTRRASLDMRMQLFGAVLISGSIIYCDVAR